MNGEKKQMFHMIQNRASVFKVLFIKFFKKNAKSYKFMLYALWGFTKNNAKHTSYHIHSEYTNGTAG